MKLRNACAAMVALAPIMSLLVAASAAATAPPQPSGWVTLMSEDFEGEFPRGFWHIGREGAPYLWGQRSCNPHRGASSTWAGGGGTQGSQIPCTGMYAPGYVTTLSYGPLDLSECTNLRLNYAHWTWLGAGDALGVGYSIDGGASWHLLFTGGNRVDACGGWCEDSLEQNRWPVPICGHSKVYLLFRFNSNDEGVSYGTFVDDVVLEAYYGVASSTPTATPTPTVTASATMPFTHTPTATVTLTPDPGKRTYLPLVTR